MAGTLGFLDISPPPLPPAPPPVPTAVDEDTVHESALLNVDSGQGKYLWSTANDSRCWIGAYETAHRTAHGTAHRTAHSTTAIWKSQ